MTPPSYRVIVTGTDPQSRRGGIGHALPGYLAAMTAAGISFESIPTYCPQQRAGRWWPWLRALPAILRRVLAIRRGGNHAIVYSHPGAGVSLLREAIVLGLARLAGARTVLQLHTPAAWSYLDNPLQKRLLQLALAPAQCVCVLTPWWHQLLRSRGVGRHVRVIPNPLPPLWADRAGRARVHSQAADNFTVLCMARLEPGKGVDRVLDAMTHLAADVRLVVAGDGSELGKLQRRAESLGLANRVTFKGWLDDEGKRAVLDEAQLFCLPTTRDSFGMSFVEAMASGLPIVALDWGPISEVVPDGRAGLLVGSEDAEELAAAIVELRPAARRQSMGAAGQRWVQEQYSAEAVGGMLREVMDTAAA